MRTTLPPAIQPPDSYYKDIASVNAGNIQTLDIHGMSLNATDGNVTDADVTVTQQIRNPSGNVGHPESANVTAGAFIEINTTPELRDNLKQVTVTVSYDPADCLPVRTNHLSFTCGTNLSMYGIRARQF